LDFAAGTGLLEEVDLPEEEAAPFDEDVDDAEVFDEEEPLSPDLPVEAAAASLTAGFDSPEDPESDLSPPDLSPPALSPPAAADAAPDRESVR